MYERTKWIKDREYRYLVRGVRVGTKVQQKYVKYLGPVKPVRKRRKGGGRKASVFVRTLNSTEIAELKKAKRSSESFRRDRAHIIIQSSQGKTVGQICNNLSKSRKTVIQAIKAFNIKGLGALNRGKARGRERKFTQEQRAKILQILLTDPRSLDLHFTTWSLPRLKKYLIDTGAVDYICIESIRNVIKAEGTTYKKSKQRQYSNDPDFLKKNLLKMN